MNRVFPSPDRVENHRSTIDTTVQDVRRVGWCVLKNPQARRGQTVSFQGEGDTATREGRERDRLLFVLNLSCLYYVQTAILAGRINRRNRTTLMRTRPVDRFKSKAVLYSCLFWVILGLTSSLLLATDEAGRSDPELTSLFPLAGQRGTVVEAEIRGHRLAGAYGVWPRSGSLRAGIKKVEVIESETSPYRKEETDSLGEKEKENLPVYRVVLKIEIDHSAPRGIYPIRLVSPLGLSNGVSFSVVDRAVVRETQASHRTVQQAQLVPFPTTVCGTVSAPGEVDYYSLDAAAGQRIGFEMVQAEGFEPQLILFRPTGSWFDPNRPTQVLFDDQLSSDIIPIEPRMSFTVPQEGRYVLEVSSLFGKGSPEASYELSISLGEESKLSKRDPRGEPATWRERTFARQLENNWIATLRSRTVETAGFSSPTDRAQSEDVPRRAAKPTLALIPRSMPEIEPNDSVEEALQILVPSIIEGRIGQPADIDNFRFHVEAGQELAFEVETPAARPPHFNPRFGIIDAQDRELFSNVHRRISLYNNNAERHVYFKRVEPKVIYTFEAGGDFVLQVRDITSRYGNGDYVYRVLVRPQIAHVGEIGLDQSDRINLSPGEAKKLAISASQEEGFKGEVSFEVAGLPPGVEAFPAVDVDDSQEPMDVAVEPEMVEPSIQESAIILLAERDTPLTRFPMNLRLHFRPIVEGKPGPNVLVQQIPLMVVKGTASRQ